MKTTAMFAVAIAMATGVQLGEATPGDCTAFEMAMFRAYRRGDVPMDQLETDMTQACGDCLFGDDDPCAGTLDPSDEVDPCGGTDGCTPFFVYGSSTATRCESMSSMGDQGDQPNPNYYQYRCYKGVGDYNRETERFGTESDDDFLVRRVGGACMLTDTGTAANCENVVEMGAQLCVWDDQQTGSQRCQVKGVAYELLNYCQTNRDGGCGNDVAASDRPAALQAIIDRVNNAPTTGTRQPYAAPSPPPPTPAHGTRAAAVALGTTMVMALTTLAL